MDVERADFVPTQDIRRAKRGVTFDGETLDSGVCHMAFFKDPDGNALLLHLRYAPLPDGRQP